ncbi:MAG TPA: hypothetical protein VLE72_00485 [Candidatus Saccharimonadales bacterium]|nr:hypothetical protein [Candidatus Saccharimonadales bacterium]
MSWHAVSGIAAGVIFSVSSGWYVLDIARSKVVVSIATFAVLALITVSQLVSLIAEHVWVVVPFTLVGAVANVLIIILSYKNKRIYFDWLDKVALLGAIAGLILWAYTKDAALNLYVLSAVTFVTFIPLVVKTFKNPSFETVKPWRLNLLASTFLLLSVNSIAAVVWVVPVRQFVCSVLINIAVGKAQKA